MTTRARPAKLRILPFTAREGGPRLEAHPFDAGHPLFAMDAHGHGFFELLYITHGNGTHRLGGDAQRVGPGDLVVVAPGEAHDARGMTGTRGWLVLFTAEALAAGRSRVDALAAMPDEVLLLAFLRTTQGGAKKKRAPGLVKVPAARRSRVAEDIAALAKELAERALGWEEAARARLSLLLVEAARLAAPRLSGLTVTSRPVVSDVFRFIEAWYTRPITLVDVAKAVGKSPAYLTDLVRRETGRSVGAWILERRMTEARRRLRETEATIAEIGEAVGFADESYFARRFRHAEGVSPSAFRQRQR